MSRSSEERQIPFEHQRLAEEELLIRGERIYQRLRSRRSLRAFSPQPVPREAMEWAVRCAGLAPSGANQQPWRFVVIGDSALKREIRLAAEEVEREFYEQRVTEAWQEAIDPLGTSWKKPFLEEAPYLIAVFALTYGLDEQGERTKHYYTNESVGLACGFLLTALHEMGLCTLTHTPSPMGFLSRILNRPPNERPFLLIPVGYPAEGATVPDIGKKLLEEIAVWHE
ncbi:MAG: nitroreductase family protein [Deltaproteobacteria bacterium]|nr:nitroreductase family protein [Deltaproteobacteria bacterium]